MTDPRKDTEILVVEDERTLADTYAAMLSDTYTVQTAYSASEALELVHPGVDIILLDRRMPGMSGDELLGELRTHETKYQVAMVTAVSPDAEILKLDIDEYLTKPVTGDELHRVVEELSRRSVLEDSLQTYLAQLSKKQTLENEQSVDALISNAEYQQMLSELASQRAKITDELARQASPQTRVAHHYSVGQILSGVAGIALITGLLVTVHIVFPDALERFRAVDPTGNPLLGYPAVLVHLSDAHLFGNVVGFVLAAGISYALCLWIISARWFYATSVGLLAFIPGLTYLLVYGPLQPLLSGDMPILVGFSGVVSGFVGFSFVVLLGALRLLYAPREILLLAGFGALSATGALLWLVDGSSAVIPAGIAVLCGLTFTVERLRQVDEHRTSVFRHDLPVLVGLSLVYTVLAFGIVAPVEGISPYSAAAHLIGLGGGVLIALLAAMAMNVFPVRETIQEQGYVLPERLF